MRVRDMDVATLRHLARELDRDAEHWGQVAKSLPDSGAHNGYTFHAKRTKGLADYYRQRAKLAARAQGEE